MTLIVVAVVSGALILGAAWGIFGKLPQQWEGFLIALAGGALIYSLIAELIRTLDRRVLAVDGHDRGDGRGVCLHPARLPGR